MTNLGRQRSACILALITALAGCGGPGPSTLTGPLGFAVQSALLGRAEYSAMKPVGVSVFLSTLTRQDLCNYVQNSVDTASGSVLSFDFGGTALVPGDYPINAGGVPQGPGAVITVSRFDLIPGNGALIYNPPASQSAGASGSATLTSVSFSDQSYFATSGDRVQGTLSVSLDLPDGGTSPLSASFDATGCP